MERKKGFQWYKTLSKKQQKQFRLNCHRYNGIGFFQLSMNQSIPFDLFLIFATMLENPPQGKKYWDSILINRQ